MRVIKYPIFLGCRDYTPDAFWKKVFEGLAYGETPRGIYFKDNSLYSVTKKKEFNYSFLNKPTSEIYQEVHRLFGTVYGLKSKGDLSRKRELFENFNSTNSTRRSEDLWTKIKKKTLKENLIQDYVIDSQKKYNLSKEQTRVLYFYLSVGCTFKLFSSSDILLKGGYIVEVNGVELSEGCLKITRKFEEPPMKKPKKQGVYLYELWSNYLKTL